MPEGLGRRRVDAGVGRKMPVPVLGVGRARRSGGPWLCPPEPPVGQAVAGLPAQHLLRSGEGAIAMETWGLGSWNP